MSRVDEAIAEWRGVLGDAYVVTDASLRRGAETATFATTQRVGAILKPGSREEVQRCMAIASRYRVAVYPVSTGKNWGYGSAVPVRDGGVILHLGRLNRIVEFDERLAYVTVEPGVTQGQLYEFLQARGSKLWMDATGASPGCSLIGNAMERGMGYTPYADRFGYVRVREVVLPTGQLIHGGLDRFGDARGAAVNRYGVGPFLDGLFTQSNLGIVTRMTQYLMPAPECFEACYVIVEDDKGLAGLVDTLRDLRLRGVITGAVRVYSKYTILSSLRRYPWDEAAGKTPLPGDVMRRMERAWYLGAWHASFGLYGTKRQVAETRKLTRRQVSRRVSGVKAIRFMRDRSFRVPAVLQKAYRRLTGVDVATLLQATARGYGLLKGEPTEKGIANTYWRKRVSPNNDLDPDRDRCGLIWCNPSAPLGGEHAARIARLTRESFARYGFEPTMGFQMITDRCLYATIAIGYDREVAGEDDRAMACHDALFHRLAGEGYYPYRLGIYSMDALPTPIDDYDRVLGALKRAVDPNHVLAPGRYSPVEAGLDVDGLGTWKDRAVKGVCVLPENLRSVS